MSSSTQSDRAQVEPETGALIQRTTTAIGQLLIGRGESSALHTRLGGGMSALFSFRVAFSILSLSAGIALARLLGRDGLGSYSYAFSWITLIGIPAILGMDQLLVRHVAAYHARSQWSELRGLLRKAAMMVSLAATAIAAVAGAISWIFFHGHDPSQALSTFWVALILVPLIALIRVRQAALQGLHHIAIGALPEQIIQPGLFLAFISGVIFFPNYQLTASVAMVLTVLSVFIAFVIGAFLFYRRLPQPVKHATAVSPNLHFMSSVIPLVSISAVNVVFAQADTLILGAFRGPSSVGLYTVAHKSADLISYILILQGSAFASTAASLYAVGDLQRLQRLVTRLARWGFLAATAVAVVLVGFGGVFLSIYGGPQFVEARLALAILALSQLFNVGSGIVGQLLVMTGNERDGAVALGVGAVVNIALTFVFVPRWGADGAAVSFATGLIVWNVWAIVALRRKTSLHSTIFGKSGSSRSLPA